MSAHLGSDRTLLIDGDYIVYSFGHSAESKYWQILSMEGEVLFESRYKKECYTFVEEEGIDKYEFKYVQVLDEEWPFIRARIDEHLNMILENLRSRQFKLYIGGGGNFRHEFVEDYKANRPPKPILYPEIREHLEKNWSAIVTTDIEADDAIGIEMTFDPDAIICTVDKDLDMIPGWHYNLKKYTTYYVTEEEGLFNFYCQLLTGDATDNIRGLYGVGKQKAKKYLQDCSTEQEYWESVVRVYETREGLGREDAIARILGVANLIWILREPQTLWEYPDAGGSL